MADTKVDGDSSGWLGLIAPFRDQMRYIHFGNQFADRQGVPGATEASFQNSLVDLEGYISTDPDGQRLLNEIRDAGSKSFCHRELSRYYESFLHIPYYRTERMLCLEGGMLLRTHFGSVSVGASPRAKAADIVFAKVAVPSTRDYAEDAIPMPAPLARFARVSGVKQPFDGKPIISIDGMEIEREGSYRVWVRLENGLQFRLSAVDDFNEEFGHRTEGFSMPLGMWNKYRTIVLRKVVEAAQALDRIRAANAGKAPTDAIDLSEVEDLIFDLAHLVCSVRTHDPLWKGFCHAQSPHPFGTPKYKTLESFRGLAMETDKIWSECAHSAAWNLYILIMREKWGERYFLREFQDQKKRTPANLETISAAIDTLACAASVMANLPQLKLPEGEFDSRELMKPLPQILEQNPDPLAEAAADESLSAEWNPCAAESEAFPSNAAAMAESSAFVLIGTR